jgi:hypothetical protein
MPQVETWQAILGVLAASMVIGFGLHIGWWAWVKLCALFRW